jgi:RHS repeat-associated protein
MSTFSYTYDAIGNTTSVQGPAGTTRYEYDANSRLTKVIDPAGGVFTFGYDSVGRQTSMTRPNGITDTSTYDASGKLTSLQSKLGATLVLSAGYTYNGAGVPVALTTPAGTATFGYDAALQLTSANFPAAAGLPNEQYTYDFVGNRTSSASAPFGSFVYDNANRLLSDGTATYQYDLEGNLLSRTVTANGATTRQTWNAGHQLLGISYADNSTSSFRYDPAGRRVEVAHGTSTSRYGYDHEAIAAEYDAANSLVASYVHDPNSPTRTLEMSRGGEQYFYLTDALGSTTALTTSVGATANTYAYGAFGTTVRTGTVQNPFTFTGQLFDPASGLYLFPLRAYDPAHGRFSSEDPIDSSNLYPYVANHPTSAVDPTGAQDEDEDTIIRSFSTRAQRRIQFSACAQAVIFQRLYVNVLFGIPVNVGNVIDITDHVLSECGRYLPP